MSIRRIYAPWTPEQVTALNAYQRAGRGHPFTCGGEQHLGSPSLVAYTDGWRCPQPDGKFCDYRQDWAPTFMIPTSKEGGPLPAGDQADRRAAVSAKLWEVAEQHIMAEWVCCEPPKAHHALCHRGYAALGMARTLLVDSEPGVAWNPAAPVLDAVMGMLLPPADRAAAQLTETERTVLEVQSSEPESGCAHCGGAHAWDDCEAYTALAALPLLFWDEPAGVVHHDGRVTAWLSKAVSLAQSLPAGQLVLRVEDAQRLRRALTTALNDAAEELSDTDDEHSCAESGCSGEPTAVPAPTVEVPLEAFRRLVKVAMWVSRGRSFAYTPDPNLGAAYPDATARFALGALHDAGLLPLVGEEGDGG